MREREKIRMVKQMQAASASVETILASLRKVDTTKINSIRILHLATGLPLGEAKRVVFLSQTWSDRFTSDEAFLDSLLKNVDRVFPEQADAA